MAGLSNPAHAPDPGVPARGQPREQQPGQYAERLPRQGERADDSRNGASHRVRHPRLENRPLHVTDGGHYDNLGLVKLLRRRCTLIYCIDASGDAPPAAKTFAEAITLAYEQLQAYTALGRHLGDLAAALPQWPVAGRAAVGAARVSAPRRSRAPR